MSKISLMKKIIITFLVLSFLLISLPLASSCADSDSPIRIHIRANSDVAEDQAVKFIVRDEVVDYISTLLSGVKGRAEAYNRLAIGLGKIEKTASKKLSDCGFGYGAKARLAYEYFPDRDYGEMSYPAGYYDALIVELGSGKGGNWWCVAYPPLCFYGNQAEEFEYSSIIAEILGL